MESSKRFVEKIRKGGVCIGTGITFTDATATEALCDLLDFVWIDMEHNALSLEAVQAHIIATKGSRTVPLVRVRANDPILIKPVLDIGAAGIIIPMVRYGARGYVGRSSLSVSTSRNSRNWSPSGFELRPVVRRRFFPESE